MAQCYRGRFIAGAAKVDHHAALPFTELPDFMAELAAREGVAARALEFAILTAARTGETIGAKWDEIHLAEKIWVIPASRMKAKKEHRVPISDRVLASLKALPREADFVFAGGRLSYRGRKQFGLTRRVSNATAKVGSHYLAT